ncbi:recombinase family protein [Brevibacillus borstelensis]|uniref:recombinase family protein n=1 Tax=Brevibacillus borstelensis TaxID=45462 RepID=UPI001D0BE303|nr:recombinase family protein [Brevibacillus borstelensis]MCC0566452.1 recombinase family protein [Brevibacillus borstelensis]MCM3559959.1 recombinase family protein [Brevibacillus borstelensis]
MNVIGYIRVSTQGQAKDGYSLSYQQDEIEAYCKEQGWNLLHVFKDEGISGARVNEDALEVDREGFQDMLATLSTQSIDYVVVLNTSRLWRSDIVKVLIHREFKKHGVDIRSIEQPTYSIHKKDPSDFLINGLMELLDQYQRLEITMKLARGRRKKAQQGGYSGGKAAFGYQVEKGSRALSISPTTARTVQKVFELRNQYPTWSLQQIASQLNLEGYRTAQDKEFTKVQVKRILDRETFYKGHYRYGDVTCPQGQHPAIINN